MDHPSLLSPNVFSVGWFCLFSLLLSSLSLIYMFVSLFVPVFLRYNLPTLCIYYLAALPLPFLLYCLTHSDDYIPPFSACKDMPCMAVPFDTCTVCCYFGYFGTPPTNLIDVLPADIGIPHHLPFTCCHCKSFILCISTFTASIACCHNANFFLPTDIVFCCCSHLGGPLLTFCSATPLIYSHL